MYLQNNYEFTYLLIQNLWVAINQEVYVAGLYTFHFVIKHHNVPRIVRMHLRCVINQTCYWYATCPIMHNYPPLHGHNMHVKL